ncbi:hypothetical protein AALP_AA4G208500 [Arabis alpina]|uniref:Uncharacterized protein n=1 Tax=Arabis alpina TaxID=50452 RepID=A0A087H4L5_ARAAL|nr:hypothetical protein AALP_AA4G208500 [Arabis alpina]
MKNSVEREKERRKEEINGFFWSERFFLLLLVVFPTYGSKIVFFQILISTLITLPYFFFFCPNLSSVGPSGIGGFWLFLLDRFTFYLGIQYSKLLVQGFDIDFLWCLTVFLSVVIHSIYFVDYLLRSRQATPPPVPQSQNDETPLSNGDVIKQVEKEKVKELDGKKIIIDMENMIHSGLETLREELGEFRDDGKKKMTQVEHMICSQFGTLRDNLRLHVDEMLEKLRDELRSEVAEVVKSSRENFNKDVKSVVDQLHETYLFIQETAKEAKTTVDKTHDTYLVIQETAKEAKTTAEKAHETYLIFQETVKEAKNAADKAHETYLIFQKDQSNKRMIRGEDIEGFCELREEVQRMSVEAEIAAEELSRATVELVEAGIKQWEEDNADYLASLPYLHSNHN